MTRLHLILCAALVLTLPACGGGGGSTSKSGSNSGGGGGGGSPGVYADRVVISTIINSQGASAAAWPYFFQPSAALGAPGGMLDVVSLGYDHNATGVTGGAIVLGIGNSTGHRCIVDGSGDDLVVYENAFQTTDAGVPGTNNELTTVEVSADNATWHTFPHSIGAGNLIDPANYSGFAGITPTADGGDRFDLADVIAAEGLPAGFQACYVRLTDGGMLYGDYGNTQTDTWDSGADIDAIEALNSVLAPALSP